MCGTVAWGVTLIAAPFVVTHHTPADGWHVAGIATYVFSGAVCHQETVRSFFVWGVPLPVCARCSGLYGGAAIAALGILWMAVAGARRPLSHRAARTLILVAAVPTAVSLVAEFGGVTDPGNAGRAFLGFPLGAAVTLVVGDVLRGTLD